VVWLAADSGNEHRLSVTFLDVGQGESILVESPSGNRVLIDGGPSGEAITAALGRQLPFYDRRIDVVIATHQQTDHIGGLPEVLDRYAVSAVLETSATAESLTYNAWKDATTSAGPALIQAVRGQEIDLGLGARLTVLGPTGVDSSGDGDANDSSVVLLLSYGSVRILLTGDIGQGAEATLLAAGTDLRADVLKVAHHGSATSTSTEFLRRVRPSVAVISAGRDNQFGLPDPETLARLRTATVYRTDEDGDIEMQTDGHNIWMKTER
jgi:competence protein ComEC